MMSGGQNKMKTKLYPAVFTFFMLFCSSCDNPTGGGETPYGGSFPSAPQSRTFRAVNMEGAYSYYYSLEAELVYEGEKCTIWEEKGEAANPEIIQNMAITFDRTIRPRMLNALNSGEKFYDDDGVTVVAGNPMEYASWLVNGDEKLNILLLDIRDGYSGSGGYVAGYFSSNDFLMNANSNKCAIIYVDINPGVPGSEQSNGTLAHEMQHLMNYAIHAAKRQYRMDTWIDEGLSTASEWIWSEKQSESRINWYNNDLYHGIEDGNNFFMWNNWGNVLDDYATAYLFFQWLRLQSGGSTNIYRKIFNSPDNDYLAVTKAAFFHGIIASESSWETLIRNWLAANYINAPAGLYGYKNDQELISVRPFINRRAGDSATPFPLYPGEGVYTQKTEMPAASAYIKYAGLPARGSAGVPNDTSAAGSSVLLSYNVDKKIYTGNASDCFPFSRTETILSAKGDKGENRAIGQASDTLPPELYPIGMEDMLAFHRGGNNLLNCGYSKFLLPKEIFSEE